MSRAPIIPQAAIDKALGRKPKLTEADLRRAGIDLLLLDGWRHLRTDPVSDRKRGKGFGELGMADDLFIRYAEPRTLTQAYDRSCARVLWIEWKKPGAVPTRHQTAWHARERSRGALTLIAGRDFPATIEGFREWYRASGLSRRVR